MPVGGGKAAGLDPLPPDVLPVVVPPVLPDPPVVVVVPPLVVVEPPDVVVELLVVVVPPVAVPAVVALPLDVPVVVVELPVPVVDPPEVVVPLEVPLLEVTLVLPLNDIFGLGRLSMPLVLTAVAKNSKLNEPDIGTGHTALTAFPPLGRLATIREQALTTPVVKSR